MADNLQKTDDDFYYSAEERKWMEEHPEPVIVEASYHKESGFEFLHLNLSDGRRLLIPREELDELKNATTEQATDIKIIHNGTGIWWPQIDDGLYLPDFLEHRWGKVPRGAAA